MKCFKCPTFNDCYFHQVFVDIGLRYKDENGLARKLQKRVQQQVMNKVVILHFQIKEVELQSILL